MSIKVKKRCRNYGNSLKRDKKRIIGRWICLAIRPTLSHQLKWKTKIIRQIISESQQTSAHIQAICWNACGRTCLHLFRFVVFHSYCSMFMSVKRNSQKQKPQQQQQPSKMELCIFRNESKEFWYIQFAGTGASLFIRFHRMRPFAKSTFLLLSHFNCDSCRSFDLNGTQRLKW